MVRENGHGALGGLDQVEAQQRALVNQALESGLEFEAGEPEGQEHHMDLLALVDGEGDPELQLGGHEGVQLDLVDREGRGLHRRRPGVHVRIGGLFACRNVSQQGTVPSASSTKNLQDHLSYQEAIKDLELASRDALLQVAKQMAYDLMVVQPEMRRRLVAMDMGSLARGAQKVVRDKRSVAEEQ
jgi:hypothetical protein